MKNILQNVLSIPVSDWFWTAAALLFIIGLLIFIELATKKWGWDRTISRKAVHLIVGLSICSAPWIFVSKVPLIILSSLFIAINYWAIRTRHLTGIHLNDQSYGTVYYPISILVLDVLLWPAYKILFVLAALIMVVADAMAALVGNNFASKFYVFYEERKSIPGSSTMFITSVILLFAGTQLLIVRNLGQNLLLAILVGIVVTAAELISRRGSDNLSVPLIAAIFLYGFLGPAAEVMRMQLSLGIILAGMVALVSYRLRFLKLNGAVVTFLLGSIIFGFGGIKYTVPILVFFILSSLLSKAGRVRKAEMESSFEKSGVRDMYQVLANGGVAGIMMILIFILQRDDWYPVYLVAVAAATADTWATEIGIFSWSKPRLITNFKQVAAGYSGAISILGSLAAVCGSAVILLAGLYFLRDSGQMQARIIWSVIGCAVLGSFIDSFIGATVQAQYQCKLCQKRTEKKMHCQQQAQLVSGKAWLNNDWVNFLSIAAATIINFILLNII